MTSQLIKKLNEASQAIKSQTSLRPKVALTLGSGLGDFVDCLEDREEIFYHQIPHFQQTTVLGHRGKLILGKINHLEVICLQGRSHSYEGSTPQEVVFPTRVLKWINCTHLILTNASGSLDPQYRAGDLVMITDHINFTGKNPLIGPNEEELGPRFPDMRHLYHPQIQKALQKAAEDHSCPLKQGIYAGVLGPSYETAAEVKMLSLLGAQIVGMSTIFEAIAAHHCGLKVGAISCVANSATGLSQEELKHEDIENQVRKSQKTFNKLLTNTLLELSKNY